MAKNTVFASSDALREVWPVSAEVDSGVPLTLHGRSGVTITASGGITRSVTVGNYTLSGIPGGGIGLKPLEVVVATDGTFEFLNVTDTDGTTPVATTTAQGAQVYITSAGALTLDATSNTAFGWVNYPVHKYVKAAGKLPVKIGI